MIIKDKIRNRDQPQRGDMIIKREIKIQTQPRRGVIILHTIQINIFLHIRFQICAKNPDILL
jgi:hypothetical protein